MIYNLVVSVECVIISLSTALTGKVSEYGVDNLSSLNSVCS